MNGTRKCDQKNKKEKILQKIYSIKRIFFVILLGISHSKSFLKKLLTNHNKNKNQFIYGNLTTQTSSIHLINFPSSSLNFVPRQMLTSTCVNAHSHSFRQRVCVCVCVFVCVCVRVRAIGTEVAHTGSSPDCEISFSEPAICEIDGAICLPVIAIQSWPRVARLKRLENRFSVFQSWPDGWMRRAHACHAC